MTYLAFHLVFTLPPLLVLAALTWRAWLQKRVSQGMLVALAVHVLLALTYTTPWDNYLVARGVWGYGEGRVLFTLGWVPFEEYLFFIIQTLICGLWVLLLHRRVRSEASPLNLAAASRVRVVGVLFWLGLAAVGVLALGTAGGTYFGLITAWAAPILALQWGIGGDLLVSRWRVVLPGFAVPTLYLWLTDRLALGAGIWWISPELSTGLHLFGLPVEEALFFLLTTLLVVFGMLLALESRIVVRLRTVQRLSGWRAVLVLWAISMIPTPLFPERFALFAYLSTGLLALGVLGYALSRYGSRAWLLFAVSFGFGLGVEWLGHTTGVPFGPYRYTAPGPHLLGVPLLVPLGWFAFSFIALSIVPRGRKRWLAPLALVAWDVGLDPLMVSQGFWVFDTGAYYGVPLSNFVGWGVSGALLVTLLLALEPRLARDTSPDMRAVFWVQAFLFSVGLLVFGLPWAALATCLAMGAVGLSASSARAPRRQPG